MLFVNDNNKTIGWEKVFLVSSCNILDVRITNGIWLDI